MKRLLCLAAVVAVVPYAVVGAPSMDSFMTAYRGEELRPTSDPTQVALCPTWTRSTGGIDSETDRRVDASRSSDYNLTTTTATYRSRFASVGVEAVFAATYAAARARRSDMPMPPATALIGTQGNPEEMARLMLGAASQAAGQSLPPTPTTAAGGIETTLPVNLTLPAGATLPGDLSNVTLPGGVRLTLPSVTTLPPLPSGIQTTIPAGLTLPAGFTTPDLGKLQSTLEAEAQKLTTLPGNTLPGGVRLTLPPLLSGDMEADLTAMMKGEAMRATVARSDMRASAPSCFAARNAVGVPPGGSTPLPTPPPPTEAAGVVDVTIRLRGSNFAALLDSPSRRASLEVAVRADLATLMGVDRAYIRIRGMRVGSLVVDYTVTSGAGVDAATARQRAESARTNTSWISATQAEYSTVSSEALTVDTVSASEGTPGPATVAPPSTAPSGGLAAPSAAPTQGVAATVAVAIAAVAVAACLV
mmetsp:Transcript_14503/g.44987  ORF Transcript_14503/g.44987 Transcript_14503/m.44987 type:complete len:474 (-) Transcript_14503:591-2012(-)